MQVEDFNLFSTEICSFKFSPQEIQPLLDEVSLKEKQIKEVSKYFNKMGGVKLNSIEVGGSEFANIVSKTQAKKEDGETLTKSNKYIDVYLYNSLIYSDIEYSIPYNLGTGSSVPSP